MITAVDATGLVTYEEGLNLVASGCKRGGAEACSYWRNFVASGPIEAPAPTSAFGLSFYANRTAAAAWCSGHSLQPDSDPDKVMCRTASGWAARAFLFKGDTLTGLMAIESAGRQADDWTRSFKAAVQQMTDTYGPPSILTARGGSCVCGDEAAESRCLENGRVALDAGWLWGKVSVSVLVKWDQQAGPLLTVLYNPGTMQLGRGASGPGGPPWEGSVPTDKWIGSPRQ
jgi:hypothetical protein